MVEHLPKTNNGTSSNKNARIAIYCVLLLAYSVFIMNLGGHLLLPFAGISSMLFETRPPMNHMRHALNVNKKRVFSKMVMNYGRRNDFISKFTETLSNNQTSANNFAALILQGDKLFCRKSQMKTLSRGKYFVQMLRQGLVKYPNRTKIVGEKNPWINGIPILIKHDDSNGCYPSTRSDKYGFPRLTWSVPTNMTGPFTSPLPPWCSAIGMPSYKMWRDLNNNEHEILSAALNSNDAFPWNAKISKAVWRGSTTFNHGLYGHLTLLDIPRSRLVKSSLERPDLIDAGFHKLVGKYNDVSIDYFNINRMMKDTVPLKEMMRYKGIIDIDGNNWSARFPSLLCTNSVIIKLNPDFVEKITQTLQPYVHYIPSSLDNLTTVVEYIMDEDNNREMKSIVSNANRWCHSKMRKDSLAKSAIASLETYIMAIDQDDLNDWASGLVKEKLVDDLVECSV